MLRSGSDLRIPGLRPETASKIRSFLLKKLEFDEEELHNSDFQGFPIEMLEDKFKSLANEIQVGGHDLNSLMDASTDDEKNQSEIPFYRDYEPTIKDYLQRANTEEQCLEIIEYCLKTREISSSEADELRIRLKRGGPRAFGTRETGFYSQQL